jgi:hypothetical protein
MIRSLDMRFSRSYNGVLWVDMQNTTVKVRSFNLTARQQQQKYI